MSHSTAEDKSEDPVPPAKIPLQDADVELAVLAALLRDPDAYRRVRPLLEASDFFDADFQAMYTATLRLGEQGKPVDVARLAGELAGDGYLDLDEGYLSELLEDADRAEELGIVPRGVSPEQCATHLRWLARRRGLTQTLQRQFDRIAHGADPVEVALTLQHLDIDAGRGPAAPRFQFMDDEAIQHLPPVEFQVEDILPANTICALWGPPGVGKSFLALELALSVAAGAPFFGKQVKRAPAIYLAAEGSAGLGARVRAWKEEHAISRRVGVQFTTDAAQLLEESDVGAFVDSILQLNERPGLVVLDTLARCMVGGDDGASKDMGLAVAAADRIRLRTGAAVLLLHHPRKDGEVERGSTQLRGAVDAMLKMKADENGRISLSCDKMKDAAPFQSLHFNLVPTGDSCVLKTANSGWQLPQLGLTDSQRAALEILPRDFFTDGASATQWLAATGLPVRTFYRVSKSLCDLGFVERVEKGSRAKYVITETGREVVTANCQDAAN